MMIRRGRHSFRPLSPGDGQHSRTLVAVLLGLSLIGATVIGWERLGLRSPSGLVTAVLWVNVCATLFVIAIEVRRRPFSLHLMHLTSLFLFLGVAPLYQYTSGRFPVAGPVSVVREQILPAALAVMLWVFGYAISYEARRQLAAGIPLGATSHLLERPLRASRVAVLLALSVLAIGYLGAVGLLGVTTRGAAHETVATFSAQTAASGFGLAFYLINQFLLRALPLVAMTAGFLAIRDARGPLRTLLGPLLFIVVAGNLLANNPLASSRLWLVTSLFALLLPFLCLRFRTGWLLVAVSIGGLAFLPALHEGRFAYSLADLRSAFSLASPMDYLASSADVDSMGMLTLCIKWVETRGHTWGMQGIGALLFWVPRFFWPDKPVGTGAMVTRDMGFDFTNLSPPIVAEAYVDFGFVGILIFATAFGWLLSSLDGAYYRQGNPRLRPRRLIDALMPFWVASMVFFTRGDLIGAVTHVAAFTVWMIPLSAMLAPDRTRGGNARG